MGDSLAQVLEFWNHAQHDEEVSNPDLNTTNDDVLSLLLAGEKAPNADTDANSDPGLTSSGLMYEGTLTQVLQAVDPDWLVVS